VALPSARAAFAQLYRELAVAGRRPALVHCTTGKDRTGWAVAALLGFLGVPAQAVMDDYLRSDAEIRAAFGFIVDDFVAQGGERSVIEPIISARPVYLEAALDEVGQRYGTPEGYLRDGLGLERDVLDALRAAFLEAV
jgi:protein-tyrosine phosphatase